MSWPSGTFSLCELRTSLDLLFAPDRVGPGGAEEPIPVSPFVFSSPRSFPAARTRVATDREEAEAEGAGLRVPSFQRGSATPAPPVRRVRDGAGADAAAFLVLEGRSVRLWLVVSSFAFDGCSGADGETLLRLRAGSSGAGDGGRLTEDRIGDGALFVSKGDILPCCCWSEANMGGHDSVAFRGDSCDNVNECKLFSAVSSVCDGPGALVERCGAVDNDGGTVAIDATAVCSSCIPMESVLSRMESWFLGGS